MLSIKNLNVSVSDIEILNNINLSIKAGEILGIVGDSGSGKTTLLRSIIGINSADFTTSGEIMYADRNLLSLSESELCYVRGREIGMVFQNAENSFSPIRTIESQMIEVIVNHLNTGKKEAVAMAEEILQKLNLSDTKRILKSYPFELSGGMNQRVGIAMAMILKPKLLLADEPTSAVDAGIRKTIVDEMVKLCKEMGSALIIVSHDRAVINYMSDTVIQMQDGAIVSG